MKYIIFLMLFLIIFSYPLSMFGFTVVPSFATTYASLDNVLTLFDNRLTKSIIHVVGGSSFDKTVSGWEFDQNLLHDSIYQEKYPYLADVHYIVGYGKMSDYTDRIYIALSTIWDDVTGKKVTDVKSRVFFCFDDSGNFLRLLIVSKGKCYYSDETITTRFESSLYSKFHNIAYIKYNTPEGDINDLFSLKVSFIGSLHSFVNSHLDSLGVDI